MSPESINKVSATDWAGEQRSVRTFDKRQQALRQAVATPHLNIARPTIEPLPLTDEMRERFAKPKSTDVAGITKLAVAALTTVTQLVLFDQEQSA